MVSQVRPAGSTPVKITVRAWPKSRGVLFSTPHYEGYGAMLIRLADVSDDDLADYLEDSYRLKAPKTLIRRLDEEDGS